MAAAAAAEGAAAKATAAAARADTTAATAVCEERMPAAAEAAAEATAAADASTGSTAAARAGADATAPRRRRGRPNAADECDERMLAAQERVYDAVCGRAVSLQVGFKASHAARKKVGGAARKSTSLHYGEVFFKPLGRALEQIKRKWGGLRKQQAVADGNDGGAAESHFYDLGAGTGKSLVAAALVHRGFSRCIGIELLPGLVAVARQVVRRYQDYQETGIAAAERMSGDAAEQQTATANKESAAEDEAQEDSPPPPPPPTATVEIREGDITQIPWWDDPDADVIFSNTLAFDDELIGRLSTLLLRLRPGVFLISSGRLPENKDFNEGFEVLDFKFQPFSWGSSTVWLHRRKAGPDDTLRYRKEGVSLVV